MSKETHIWSLAKKYPIPTIILTGVFFRLLVVFIYQHITIYPDSEGYIDLSARLLAFDLSGYEGQRSPGYPLLLAICNISTIATVVIQMLLGILTLIYLHKTLVLLDVREGIALLSTIVVAAYLPTIFFELTILTESLTLFVIVLSFYLFFRLFKGENNPIGKYILLALLVSFLVLIKPFYIFLPLILSGALLIRKMPIKHSMWLALFPLLVFFGWSYVNKLNTGHFVSTTYYGFNLAQNCVSFAEKTTPEYQKIGNIYAKYRDANDTSRYELAMTVWEAYPELKEQTGLSFPDLSERMYDYSIATIQKNPAAYAKQVFISWRDFWKTSLYWESDKVRGATEMQYLCYAERIILQLIKFVFVLIIPLHIVRYIRRRELSPQLVISLVVLAASVLQAIVTYGTNSRFSFPFEILIVVSVIVDYLQYKRHRKEKTETR
ncbi:hypothetical protein [Dysgonomonas sp. 25]|uniref:hypothetical protein n=1 Tax=Dysgonomonas sp. 25 TaxID=2302933 RepID=UPI0013D4A309|nr:hypothetical protein [Dysgonomonas sp. 25]NDV68168.1 hypothetical protein [Dysgonomonas sp. 25]